MIDVYMYTFNTGNGTRHNLVENVVRTFQRLLGDDTGLFQQVCKKMRKIQQVNKENILKNTKSQKEKNIFKDTYKFQYQHQPIYQWGRNEYG